jgi:hypothetical protein
LVRGRGDRLVVRARWQRKASSATSVAECLRDGMEQLRPNDSTLVVAGAADAACGMAEVEVPALKAGELRGALGFELARNCPLPTERVTWGYRVLSHRNGSRVAARLFYLRQMVWEHWLEAVGGLKLDALVPPQVALDPVLAEQPAALPLAGGARFAYQPTLDGGRALAPVNADSGGAFGVGDEPLAWGQLSLGPLQGLPADEQASYASAVLLGAYGASTALGEDADGALPVPYNLRPRRNQLNRFLAVVLALMLVVLGIVAGWREYVARKTCLAGLQAENARVDREIARATGGTAADSSAKAATEARDVLAKELKDATAELDRPTLPAVLVELTETVGENTWCTGFTWRDGSVSVELQEDEEDLELVRNLDLTPVIGDVLEESKRRVGTTVRRKLKMNARWDLSTEESSATPPRTRGKAEPQPDAATDATDEPEAAPDTAPDAPKEPPQDAAGDEPKIPVTPAPGVPPSMRHKPVGDEPKIPVTPAPGVPPPMRSKPTADKPKTSVTPVPAVPALVPAKKEER